MNIFYVDENPIRAARDLCDQHVTKMILESCQLLAAAHHLTDGDVPEVFPSLTHRYHPCSRWTRSSIEHYRWLFCHAAALCEEFSLRFGHDHSWKQIVSWLVEHEPELPNAGFSEPPQVMPDEFKVDGDAVMAYRGYYRGVKLEFAKWRHGKAPDWIIPEEMRQP